MSDTITSGRERAEQRGETTSGAQTTTTVNSAGATPPIDASP